LLGNIIKIQGWRNPVVVSARSGLIIKGHGRLAAATKMGFTEIPVDIQHYETEESEIEDMIADNRISELSTFDTDSLGQLIAQLSNAKVDLSLAGFTADDLKAFQNVTLNLDTKVDIPMGEQSDFHQMTFIVSTAQQDRIYEALAMAKKLGSIEEDSENKNQNGNALFAVCDNYMGSHGDSQTN
jgi:ParB-like chromosome segregation protein Spo0J